VFISRPEDVRALLAAEGRTPHQRVFQILQAVRYKGG
jgi:hypothetical protein